jgi:hypothetical protein
MLLTSKQLPMPWLLISKLVPLGLHSLPRSQEITRRSFGNFTLLLIRHGLLPELQPIFKLKTLHTIFGGIFLEVTNGTEQTYPADALPTLLRSLPNQSLESMSIESLISRRSS